MRYGTVDPHSGGLPIPTSVKQTIVQRLQKHALLKYKGLYARIEVRFRGPLCYMDAYQEPRQPDDALLKITHESREEYFHRRRQTPVHLGRMRYFGNDKWSYAFYSYGNDRYEPSVFQDGDWFGTPEAALDIGAIYLQDE